MLSSARREEVGSARFPCDEAFATTMRISLCLLLIAVPLGAAAAQTVPADFELVATAGGAFPGGPASETVTVHILADGSATYTRYLLGIDAPDSEPTSFTVSTEALDELWHVIEANNFFDLEAEYADTSIFDRTFAHLFIAAEGSAHSVLTENVAVNAFDSIMAAVNEVTPDEGELVYDVSEPVPVTPVGICEQPGKQGSTLESYLPFAAKSPGDLSTLNPAGSIGDAGVTKLAAVSDGPLANEAAHPGTVAAYVMPLAEAADRGIASLSAKGESFGDAIQIDVDNAGSATTDDLQIRLYLELYGRGASDAVAARVESGIEEAWSGTTSDGKMITVDVITRVADDQFAPPGTPGFHQIEMIPSDRFTSDVHEHSGDPFTVNHGTGGGKWQSVGSNVEVLYAHEAGHLFGFEDRYDDWVKQGDEWKMKGADPNSEGLTDEQLAEQIAPRFPDRTPEEVLEYVKSGNRRTSPRPGHEFDLMARWRDGVSVAQSDLDALAALAGLLVEVRAGDALLNKWGNRQNMAIMKDEDVFAPAGETATLEGLYAACIERAAGIPNPGDPFDLAPAMSEWQGIEAASYVATLLEYLNAEERFCPSDKFAQPVLWRLTNNAGMGNADIAAYLAEVGIDVGFRDLDFPSLSNPNALNPSTSLVTPDELFVPSIASSAGDIAEVAGSIFFTADLSAPASEAPPADYLWILNGPDESTAELANREGEATTLTPDVRGVYELQLRAILPDSVTGVSGDGTFTQRTTLRFVAVDDLVETFESGEIVSEGPFFWRNGGAPWIVTDEISHTGSFAARSAPIGDNATSTLTARFDQLEAGPLSFTYRLASHFSDSLLFIVDGVIYERFSPPDPWTTVTVDLPAGLHTVSWRYVKDGSDSHNADRAWLDDVFFPISAVITDVEDPNDKDLPEGPTLRLWPNAPNPFSVSTTIRYTLPRAQMAEFVVYDALGRRLAVLASGFHAAGTHRVEFEAGDRANGIYHYQLRTEMAVRSGTMVRVR